MSSVSGSGPLNRLARLYGIQTAYYDVLRRRRIASVDALLAVLKVLGAPVESPRDAVDAIRHHQQSLWSNPLAPVNVAWDDHPITIDVRLPLKADHRMINGRLTLENGTCIEQQWMPAELPATGVAQVEGESYVIKRTILSKSQPWGYHTLDIEIGGEVYQTLVISAPYQAYRPALKHKTWGIFAPLYSLHSDNSMGIGSYTDLEKFMLQSARMGSRLVATLPLLPLLDDEPSPYRPLSRLFWGELYIDVNAVPELVGCVEAQAILKSQDFLDGLSQVKRSNRVDYEKVMRLKRMVIEPMCRFVFSTKSHRLEQLQSFISKNPLVEDYANFRAACESRGKPWQLWPESSKNGVLTDDDYDEQIRRYHLYTQWLAAEQMEALCSKAAGASNGLYLDLPLGVHPGGYDAWRYQKSFIQNVSAGAPPDVMFTSGQNWGFEPLHPEAIRRSGYRYLRQYLRHHMTCAAIVRLDHVMGLHRTFCIPDGMTSEQGVYLRYHTDELYAVLCLESSRAGTMVVGEDLGTVPGYVRPTMARHHLLRMHVLNYEMESDSGQMAHPVVRNCVASINTHDMFPFAAYWLGLDIEQRLRLGFVKPDDVDRERAMRQTVKENLVAFLKHDGYLKNSKPDTIDVIRACLAYLSASSARAVLVNIEDLWMETEPQNVPGTHTERPNWRKKLPFSLEQIAVMPQVIQGFEVINEIRGRAGAA